MASYQDYILYLTFADGGAVNMVRTDGGAHRRLFSRHCDCPDGLALDLRKYTETRRMEDITVWWGTMGKFKSAPQVQDKGDWHEPNGYLVRAPLFGGDAAAERVLLLLPANLVNAASATYARLPHHSNALITTAKQVALTKDGKSLFFCDREGHCVQKYNSETHEVVPVLLFSDVVSVPGSASAVPNSLEDAMQLCVGIALDETNNYILFTVKGPSKGGKGIIYAAPYNFHNNNLPFTTPGHKPGAEGVIQARTVTALRSNLPEPIDLLLDPEKGMLYWTDRGDEAMGGNTLNRATYTIDPITRRPKLGPVEVLLSGFDETIGLSWAAALGPLVEANEESRRYMYVSDGSGRIYKCDLVCKEKECIHKVGDGIVTGIAFLRLYDTGC